MTFSIFIVITIWLHSVNKGAARRYFQTIALGRNDTDAMILLYRCLNMIYTAHYHCMTTYYINHHTTIHYNKHDYFCDHCMMAIEQIESTIEE